MHRAIRIAFFFALIYCILYAEINSTAVHQPSTAPVNRDLGNLL
jgi:hypothetical protein